MKFIKAGATSQSITFLLLDDDGNVVTGKVAATLPNIYYHRTNEARAQITPLVDAAAIGSVYGAGKVFEVGGGRYRLDLPDAAVATATTLDIMGDTTGMHVIHEQISVGLDLSGTTVGLTATAIQAIWDKATSALTTAGSIGKYIVDEIANLFTVGGDTFDKVDSMEDVVTTISSSQIPQIQIKTDNLPASPAAVGSAMTLANGAVTTSSIADGAITDAKITVPTVNGVATGVLGMIVQTWRRFFKKVTKSSSEITTYADNGTSVLTTQAISGDGTATETQGPAT